MTTTREAQLEAALKRSTEGWANALELGLIPERHRNTAFILRDDGFAALAARPAPQPAADTRVVAVEQLTDWLDIIALLSPGFVWGSMPYNDTLPKQNALQREIRAIIGTATPAQPDKIAEAARALDASDEVKTYLDGVIGVVEANSFESMCLWQARGSKTWVSSGCGYGQTVGKLDGRPVAISLTTSIIDGHKVAFIDATSEVVDWPLIEAWLLKNLPATAIREDGRVNKTDAMNFTNVFPRAIIGGQDRG